MSSAEENNVEERVDPQPEVSPSMADLVETATLEPQQNHAPSNVIGSDMNNNKVQDEEVAPSQSSTIMETMEKTVFPRDSALGENLQESSQDSGVNEKKEMVTSQEYTTREMHQEDMGEEKAGAYQEQKSSNKMSALVISGIAVAVIGAVFALTRKLREK